jgi:crotonobetainyl-CoA:carnitine CoA-transferase CaiB-like acyl-CoA transferase
MLEGVRVVDRTGEIAGPYCSKLLADAGADVVKAEPPGGDPLRRWREGALFDFLNTSKRSIVGDGTDLVRTADVLLTGRAEDRVALWAANPALVIVAITPFGLEGPWAGRPATEFTLQAWCGSTGYRGYPLPDGEPVAAGGRLGEWITGTYAAVAALAALRRARTTGRGEHVDLAMLDCMTVTMSIYPSVFSSFFGWPDIEGTGRTVEVPSIEPTADGYAVFTTNSAQQFEDFCVLVERPDFLEDPKLARPNVRFERRDEFLGAVHEWTTPRTTDEVLAAAALLRIPSGPVLNGQTVLGFPHFAERGVYVANPSGRFVQPRVPFRVHGIPPRPFTAAPALGADTGTVDWSPRPPTPPSVGAEPRVMGGASAPTAEGLPLEGVRVVDCTAWWAGPAAPHVLGCLGADVVKVESVTRPDLMRYASTRPPTVDQWWEWGPIFHAVNVNKRAVTLDLTRPDGVELFEQLVRTADVLLENYTPRVMEQFGLGWERLHELNPDLIMVRMPAFGLDGPWRDNTGFAQTMESVSGLAWLTGFPDGPPMLVRGACDPLAGMHAVAATLLALLEREERGGGGRLVESVMVEAALNAAAEQVIEYSTRGTVPVRDGHRGPYAAPQGLYPCAGFDRWLALAIATDDQWDALRAALGDPDWARGADLETADGRRAAHDRIDEELRAWSAGRDADDAAEHLATAGVPAAVVIPSRDVVHNPQLRARGLFEVEHHPVTGDHEIPTMPFRFAGVDAWLRRPSPVLGEHNREILGELGLDDAALAALEASGLVGDRPAGL